MSHAKIIRFPELLIKLQENGLSHSRFGFVVSKAIDKKAIARNRIKRVVRSVVEEAFLNKTKATDALFVIRPGIKSVEKTILRKRIREIIGGVFL